MTIEEVFRLEESPLIRYAFGILGRRELAEEVVQEAFLKLHGHWGEVELPRPWLYRCVRNLALNVIRKSRREEVSDELEGRDSGERPDEECRRMEALGQVRMLLAEMGRRDREMIHLKYFEEKKYAEIAEKTGLSVGNVGYRLHHLLKEMAESLRKLGIEGGLS
ncbi:MAG: RNA polymerase sigma factor [Verrucomicrobiales bacterium]